MTTPPFMLPDAPLPDATPLNWVDQYAPAALRPWLKLGRFDRPIGIWLLFLPGAMGLAYAEPLDYAHPAAFPWYRLLLFFIGAALMRAAGCAYNDFVDRDIDAKVERTRSRPIPAGHISPKQALLFVAVCSLISLGILIQLGTLAIILGIASLGLVAVYPFMKRITWWPQAWLGLTFNWGFVMGVAAMTGRVTWPAIAFYAGLVFWTIGYDTIYALQDIEDDAMIGVKSSARALGGKARIGVAVFYALAMALTAIATALSGRTALFFAGLALVALHFVYQVWRLRLGDGNLALTLFKSNRTTGLLWLACLYFCIEGRRMKMKPALSLGLASLLLCACSPHEQQASGSASTSAAPVAALDFAQSNPDAQVSLHLPEGVKSYPDLHTQLYDEGRTTLEAFIGQAHKSRAENSADGIDDPAYYHNITWKITAQSPRLVSLYATDDDFEGGAHPSASFQTVLWDKQTNARVPADKLLTADADLREVDAYLCRQVEAERSRRAGEPTTQAGSGFGCPKFADSHLVLMPSTVSGKIGAVDVLFAPYDVGAYAEGPYEIRVPQSQLKGLISSAYADQFAGDAAGGEALQDADAPAPQAQ